VAALLLQTLHHLHLPALTQHPNQPMVLLLSGCILLLLLQLQTVNLAPVSQQVSRGCCLLLCRFRQQQQQQQVHHLMTSAAAGCC
jgi:hypothetical protein